MLHRNIWVLKNKIFYSLLLIFAVSAISSCGSKKNTLIKKAYHNVTAHYNGYFNAKLKIDAEAKSQEKAYVDKYEEILSVYKIIRPDGSAPGKNNNQPLDDAIKKASVVIQRHEISTWIDDCYFEIGRAYFYKKDYFTAAETFQFIAGKYKKTEPANMSYLWLIRTYTLQKKYQQAESVINIVLASETFPKKYLNELFASTAYYYIERKNYKKGIEYLEKAIAVEKKKSKKARYTYILAQLYEKVAEESKAGLNYQRVVKLNPAYELMFNARINAARLAQTQSVASRKAMEKELLKMLKDDKNIEYRDQIYYGLGLIYEKESDEDKTIATFQKSAAYSIGNTGQKGKTYLKLAHIYYDKKDYENAQLYYDSTYTFLSKTNEEYELVTTRKNSLLKLVTNLKIIKKEDSLLRVARMPESERIRYIDGIVTRDLELKRKREEEEQRLAEAALNNMANNSTMNNSNNAPGTPNKPGAGTTWYFYNMAAKGVGASDFNKKYGRRTLEDNWRRSNKESILNLFSQQDSEEENKSNPGEKSSKSNDDSKLNEFDKLKKQYLSEVPLTNEAKQMSVDKIVRAYYNIGQFYRSDIIDLRQSIKAYETALLTFPENKLEPEFYYNLYRVNTEINNTTQSEYYKKKLIEKYPNTVLAKVVLDPSYTSEAKVLEKNAQEYYDNLYWAYKNASYEIVISSKPRIDSVYANTSIAPKYAYLYAICNGKLKGNDALETCLNDLITKYPSSDAATMAREHLNKIYDLKNPALAKSKSDAEAIYTNEVRAKFSIMISTNMDANLKTSIQNLTKFNTMQFALSKLNVQSELLTMNEQLILISDFENYNKAKEYQIALSKSESELIKFNKAPYFISIISESNLKTLRNTKKLQEYIIFYTSNYK